MSDSENEGTETESTFDDSPVRVVKAKVPNPVDDSSDGDDDDDDDDDDDSSADGSFASVSHDGSDDEDSSDANDKRRKSTLPSDAPPDGISEEAYKTFFSKPVEDDGPKRKAPARNPSLDFSEHLVRQAEVETERRRNELNMSTHSLRSCEEMLQRMSVDLEQSALGDEPDFEVEDINIEEEAKNYKRPERGIEVSKSTIMRDKRDMRLAKVRDRIRAKEEEKERENDRLLEAKMKEAYDPHANLDMSEDARRERAYAWYTRMAMPARDAMKEKVDMMPMSAGVSVDDVDLLPWNATGKMVNVAKMQSFINAGFKKKFASKKKPTTAAAAAAKKGSDSDSD